MQDDIFQIISYEEERGRPAPWLDFLRRLGRNRLAILGLGIVLFMSFVGIFGPWLAPYSYRTQNLHLANRPPSLAHPLGTDALGRDVLSRIIWGARTALIVSTIVVALGLPIGIFLGSLAGYLGGLVDTVIMRLADFLFAFPGLLFVLFIASTIKPSVVRWVKGMERIEWVRRLEGLMGMQDMARKGYVDYIVVILALSLVGWPGMARLVRGQFLSLKEREFVEAARAVGASPWRIITRHILPNALPPVIVAISLSMGGIILSEASLSFIGIGIQPPNASWGSMIADNYMFWRTRPHMVIVPGLVLAMLIFAFNFLGDGLNDALNPQRR